MRLLLVDDDERLAASLARMLRHHFEAEVVVAHDGVAALELVRGDPDFEAAIVDLDLPRLDGAALVEELASVAPRISCGLWSGSPRLLGADAAHAAFRVSKGRDFGALVATVERMLARRRLASTERP